MRKQTEGDIECMRCVDNCVVVNSLSTMAAAIVHHVLSVINGCILIYVHIGHTDVRNNEEILL